MGYNASDVLNAFGSPGKVAGFDNFGVWRSSGSYLTRCYIDDPVDQVKFETIKHTVNFMNQNGLFEHPMRLVKKPRIPKKRMALHGRTRPVGYNYSGDVIGGIANAEAYDVYLYRISQW
jgi:hypothetical protein